MGGREVGGRHAMQNAATVRQVRSALALQVGKEKKPIGTWWNTGNCLVHFGMIPSKEIAKCLSGDGDIHRAKKRHPMVGAVAESGDLALRVDDRLVGAGENRAAGSEAGGDNARACVCRADGGHHVVPSPAAHNDLRRKPPIRSQQGQERSCGLQRRSKRWEHFHQAGIDGVANFPAPSAGANIHQRRSRGVTKFHAERPGELQIEEVMRQRDMGETGEIRGLVLFEPKNFWRSESRQDVVSREFDGFFTTAEFGTNFVALSGGRCVAPEFGRTDDLMIGIERHEAVLLSGDADPADLGFSRSEIGEDLGDGLAERVPPDGWILLSVTSRQALDEIVGLAGGGHDFPRVAVEGDGFQALRAAVDAERDHWSSLTMFSRYSWPPLERVGAGWERAIFSSSANDALPARTFFPRSESHVE